MGLAAWLSDAVKSGIETAASRFAEKLAFRIRARLSAVLRGTAKNKGFSP